MPAKNYSKKESLLNVTLKKIHRVFFKIKRPELFTQYIWITA